MFARVSGCSLFYGFIFGAAFWLLQDEVQQQFATNQNQH